mgnify:CR=1 FL=1
MRTIASLIIAVGLASCTSVKPMMAPSGAQGFKIWCEVASQCYERAAQQCPSGYTIEAAEKDYWGLGDVDGNLFIVCKQPQAIVPVGGTTPTAGECEACKRLVKP